MEKEKRIKQAHLDLDFEMGCLQQLPQNALNTTVFVPQAGQREGGGIALGMRSEAWK